MGPAVPTGRGASSNGQGAGGGSGGGGRDSGRSGGGPGVFSKRQLQCPSREIIKEGTDP